MYNGDTLSGINVHDVLENWLDLPIVGVTGENQEVTLGVTHFRDILAGV